MNKAANLIVITGPTATGKTSFAAHLAYQIDGEIISADSRQVYRNMNIGTGKDYDDYIVNGKKIPYHLVDIHQAGYDYNVSEFQNDFKKAFTQIAKLQKVPILVGGTGFYIEAVLQDLNKTHIPKNIALREKLEKKTPQQLSEILKEHSESTYHTVDINNSRRVIRAIEILDFQKQTSNIATKSKKNRNDLFPTIFGIHFEREIIRQKTTHRLQERIKQGMIEEVEKLIGTVPPQRLIKYGLEYKFITLYLMGEMKYEEMIEKLNTAIHQFAKRQMTWFRRMEKNGFKIHWIDGNLPMHEKIKCALNTLNLK